MSAIKINKLGKLCKLGGGKHDILSIGLSNIEYIGVRNRERCIRRRNNPSRINVDCLGIVRQVTGCLASRLRLGVWLQSPGLQVYRILRELHLDDDRYPGEPATGSQPPFGIELEQCHRLGVPELDHEVWPGCILLGPGTAHYSSGGLLAPPA